MSGKGQPLYDYEFMLSTKFTINENGCWLFRESLTQRGYGQVTFNYKVLRAHRVAYEYWRGNIPPKMLVLHTCDVRHCINPAHLFLGTDLDNKKDARNKGRLIQDKVTGKFILTVNYPFDRLTNAPTK